MTSSPQVAGGEGGGSPSYLEQRMGLAGRVAVVHGGGGGLGAGIALDLARAGVHLCLADRDEQALAVTAAEARRAGVSVLERVLDVREPEALARFYADVAAAHDRLDVLVNVVGGVIRQPFAENRPKGWDALYRANYQWLLHATQQALPLLRRSGRGGSIINLTSIEAHRAAPGFAVYAGFKAAVTGFTKSLAVELAPEGIRVNTIEPDMVPTGGIRTVAPDDGTQVWEETEVGRQRARIGIPMGRAGRLDDVAGAALFLASDLSSYVTGTSLHPDGGVTAAAGFFHWPQAGWTNVPPAGAVTVSAVDDDPTQDATRRRNG